MTRDSDAPPPNTPPSASPVGPAVLVRSWLVLLGEDESERGAAEFGQWLAEDGATHRVAEVREPEEQEELPEPGEHGGIVVARRADAASLAFVRLGARVRKMADATSEPLAIVPHDLERAEISMGPVLLAVDPHSTPPSAAAFADDLARSKGLPLLLVHVAPVPLMSGSPGMGATMEVLHLAYEAEERQANALRAGWSEAHGLRGARRMVVRGNVRHAIQGVARREDASVLVCGTQQRTVLQRALDPSCALELARYARRPVILVPADDDERQSSPADANRFDWTATG